MDAATTRSTTREIPYSSYTSRPEEPVSPAYVAVDTSDFAQYDALATFLVILRDPLPRHPACQGQRSRISCIQTMEKIISSGVSQPPVLVWGETR